MKTLLFFSFILLSKLSFSQKFPTHSDTIFYWKVFDGKKLLLSDSLSNYKKKGISIVDFKISSLNNSMFLHITHNKREHFLKNDGILEITSCNNGKSTEKCCLGNSNYYKISFPLIYQIAHEWKVDSLTLTIKYIDKLSNGKNIYKQEL